MPVPLIVPNNGGIGQERLSEVERAYHLQVLAEVAKLAAIDQQLAALQTQRAGIVGVRDSWMRFQKDARGLDDGDTIDGEGYIYRQSPGLMTVPDGDGPHEGGV